MIFILFIAAVFGVLNVIFLFVVIGLNELLILTIYKRKWVILIILAIIAFIILYLFSPEIDPVNLDLLTITIIVLFSTIIVFTTFKMFTAYRSRFGTSMLYPKQQTFNHVNMNDNYYN